MKNIINIKTKKVGLIICVTCFLMSMVAFFVASFSIGFNSVQASGEEYFAMQPGASARIKKDSYNGGLRFGVEMNETVKNLVFNNERYDLYVMIAPTVYFDSYSGNYYELVSAGKCINISINDESRLSQKEGNYCAVACIYNIKPGNIGLDFTALAYIYDNVNKEVYNYASFNKAEVTRSIDYVVNSAALDYAANNIDKLVDVYDWYGTDVHPITVTTLDQYDSLVQYVNGGYDFTSKSIRIASDVNIEEASETLDEGKELSAKTLYTVTFNSNGGTAISSQAVEEGGLIIEPNEPTRGLYVFAGWYLGEHEFDFENETVSGNITLNAAWTMESGEMDSSSYTYYYKQLVGTYEAHTGTNAYNIAYQGKTAVLQSCIDEISNTGGALSAYYNFNYSTIQHWIDNNYEGVRFDVYIEGPLGETVTASAFNGQKSVVLNVGEWTTVSCSITTLINMPVGGYMFRISGYSGTSCVIAIANIEPIEGYIVSFITDDGGVFENQYCIEGDTVTDPSVNAIGYDYLWKYNGSTYNFGKIVSSNMTLYGTKTIKQIRVTGGSFEDYKYGDSANNGSGTLSYDTEVAGKTAYVYGERTTAHTGGVLSCQYSFNITVDDIDRWIADGYKQIRVQFCLVSPSVAAKITAIDGAESDYQTINPGIWYVKYLNLSDFRTYIAQTETNLSASWLFRIWRPSATGTYGIAISEFEISKDVRIALTTDSSFGSALIYGADVGGSIAYVSGTQEISNAWSNAGSHILFNNSEISALIDAGYTYLHTKIYTNRTSVQIFADSAYSESISVKADEWNDLYFSLTKLNGWTANNLIKVMNSGTGTYSMSLTEFRAVKEYTVTFKDNLGNTIDSKIVKGGNTVAGIALSGGYVSDEWWYNGEIYDFSTPVERDIDLYTLNLRPVIRLTEPVASGSFYYYKSGSSSSGTVDTYTSAYGKEVYLNCSVTTTSTGGVLSCQFNYDTTSSDIDGWLENGYVAFKTMLYITAPEGISTVKLANLYGYDSAIYPVNTWIPFYIDLNQFKTSVIANGGGIYYTFRILAESMTVAGTYGMALTEFTVCKLADVAENMSVIRNHTNFKYNGAAQTASFNTTYQGRDCDVVYNYTGVNNKAMLIPLVPNVSLSLLSALKTAGYEFIEVDYYIETSQLLTDTAMIQGGTAYGTTLYRNAWTTLSIDIDTFIDQYAASQMITIHSYKIYAPGYVAISDIRAVNEDIVPTVYTVTFKDTDESIIDTQEVVAGKCATLPDNLPTRAGFEIIGWNLGGSAYSLKNVINADISLTAVWGLKAIKPNVSSQITGTGNVGTIETDVEIGGKIAAIKGVMDISYTYANAIAAWKYDVTVDDVDAWIALGYTHIKTEVYFTGNAAATINCWGYRTISNTTFEKDVWIPLYIDISDFRNVVNYNSGNIFVKVSNGYSTFTIACSEFTLYKGDGVEVLPTSTFVGSSNSTLTYGEEIDGLTSYIRGSATVNAAQTATANLRLALTLEDINSKIAAGYTHLYAKTYLTGVSDTIRLAVVNDDATSAYYCANTWITVKLNLQRLKDCLDSGYLFKIFANVGGVYSIAVADFEFVIEPIIENVKSIYKIYIPTDADAEVANAAQELQFFVQEATGFTLPIVRYYTYDDNIKYISLGNTLLAQNNDLSASSALGNSGFSIRTIDENIFIYGQSGKGVLNGVYYYLNETLNFDFFITDTYALDQTDLLGLSVFNSDITYDVEYSALSFGYINKFGSDYSKAKNRLGVYKFDEIFANNAFHNAFTILPKEVYQYQHSRWYSSNGNQICYSARGNTSQYNSLKNELANKFYDYLMASPSLNVVAFNMMDTDEGDICKCSKCTSNKNTYGAWSANIVLLLNQVAPMVQSKLTAAGDPRATTFKISFMAYHDYCDAPDNVSSMVLNTHVVPMICDSNLDLLKGINDSANSSCKANILDWANLASELFLYGYDIQYLDGGYMIPYMSYKHYADLYAFAKANKISFVYLENQVTNTFSTGFNSLKAYLQAKLACDSTLDVDDLKDEFFAGMYGSKAAAVKGVFDSMEEFMAGLANKGVVGGRTTQKTGFFDSTSNWNSSILWGWYNGLSNIESDLTLNSETQAAKNVRVEKIFPMYVLLRLYRNSVTEDFINEFTDLCEEFGIDYIAMGETVEAFLESL